MKHSLFSRAFDVLLRHRAAVILCMAVVVAAGILEATRMRIDMSFRPTFTSDASEIEKTSSHERVFGQVGFRDLVAMAHVGNASDPRNLQKVAELADRLRAVPSVIEIRDPVHFPFFDRHGSLQPLGLAGPLAAGMSLDSPEAKPLIEDLLRTPSARRLVVGDDNHLLAVTASIDIPNEDFARRREAVAAFRRVIREWSTETGIDTEVTGYPEVEQVYAKEVLSSVLRSIALLLTMMVVILFVYFGRWTDVVTCLAGVTLSVPIVLGLMRFLGQPFSIVNSQVLTLVLIVGIGQALHHQEEYRRRREAGRDHTAANREAFSILAWPSFMTGLATTAGFAALMTADMKAIWSFGLSTALGVAIVYLANWLVVPPLIQHFYKSARPETFQKQDRSWTLSIVRRVNALLQRRPRLVVFGFVTVTIVLALAGMSGLSVDQKVNEELPAAHPALQAETTYERELAGFLGPELSIRPQSGDVRTVTNELVAFVNRLCELPEVRYVASPLDVLPQPLLDRQLGKACHRQGGDLGNVVAARQGAAGPAALALSTGLISKSGDQAAVIVRVADIGTAKSLPFVERLRAAARETMPHAVVQPVGQWWLAQQGMNRLSFDIMLSAITALLVILPIMWAAIRDLKLFLAAIPPTILPVLATLGFMGLTHITVRIGTAMILAIALGLAADDTVHLSVRIRDRIRSGSDPASAVTATMLRTGRPCSFSSYVLIGGFGSMMASSLLALQAMGLIAMFTMTFALATDLVLGPAIYLLLQPKPVIDANPDERGTSLRSLLVRTVYEHPEQPAINYPVGSSAIFRTLTWHELTRVVLDVADALDAAVGPARIVAVLATTDARYPVLELAVGLTGRTLQPLYVESTDDELRRALQTSGAEVLVVGRSQTARVRAALLHPKILDLDSVVALPEVGGTSHAALPPDVEPFDTRAVQDRLRALPARAPGTPLLYLQSTGTTGPARLIEMSESALVHAVRIVQGEASHRFPRFLSFLPTAHISERFLTLYVSIAVAGHTWYGGGLSTLASDLRTCRPTVLLAPPLLLTALQAEAITSAASTRVGRALLRAVQRTADELLASGVVGGARRTLSNWLFGRQLRQQAGLDRVEDAFAGTAPLSAPLHAWFEAAGIPLRVVYGQTELAGATAMTARQGTTFGAVGILAHGVEVRFSGDDEMLVRSDSLFTRYVGDAKATAATLEGGWLRTGDRAKLLPSGELVLLGRVQALVTAADGTVVDTARIADHLRQSLGDLDIVFPRALPYTGVYLYAAVHARGVSEPSLASAADPRWDQIAKLVEETDPHHVVRGWALFDGAFEQASGEVGPTGKARGWRIHERHSGELRRRPLPRRSYRDAPPAVSATGSTFG